MKTVSVIIPTYNRAKYIGEALNSVISQKLPYGWDMEVIVVDDGSTDDTYKIIKPYVEKGVKYYKIKHSGSPAVARNFAIKKAKGLLIAFQDSDDKWVSNKFIKQKEIFENETIILSYGNAEIISEAGKKSKETIVTNEHLVDGENFEGLLLDNVISTLTVIARTKCIKSAGGFNESDSLIGVEDYDLWLRLLNAHPEGFKAVQTTLAYYRKHVGNVSNVSTAKANFKLVSIFEGLYDQIEDSTKRKLLTKEIIRHGHILAMATNDENPTTIPAVSVVMSVFNGHSYVKKAIEGILNQTFKDFEFIIIDDGSTDNSVEIIESFSDYRIRLMRQSNHGLVYSLNKGISLARAEIIARQDDDDISMPTRLEKEFDWIQSNKRNGLVGTFITYIDLNSKPFSTEINSLTKSIDIKRSMYYFNPIAHGSSMFRKKAFLESGGYRQEYYKAEDYDLWRRIVKKWQVGQIPEPLYHYRINPKGISQLNKDEQTKLTKRIIEEQYSDPQGFNKSLLNIIKDYYVYKRMKSELSDDLARKYKESQIDLAVGMLHRKRLKIGLNTALGAFILAPRATLKRFISVIKKSKK